MDIRFILDLTIFPYCTTPHIIAYSLEELVE